MDEISFNLRARGEIFKLLLVFGLAFLCFSYSNNIPKKIKKTWLGKTRTISLQQVPTVAKGVSGAFILIGLYIIILAKTTKLEAGRVNISLSRGIFVRSKDALDMTGILDFSKERTLLDMILGVSRFSIYSRDKTHSKLILRGVTNTDAEALYEHLIAYTNKSMVEYVQGQAERNAYNKKRNTKQDKTWRKNPEDGGDHHEDDGED